MSLTVKVIDKYGNWNWCSYISKNNTFLEGATKDLKVFKIKNKVRVEDQEVEMNVSPKKSRRDYFGQRQCCQKLKISSNMALSKFYPDLIGVYENIKKGRNWEKPIFK